MEGNTQKASAEDIRARPWIYDAQDLARALSTDVAKGLSSTEASARLLSHGPNEFEAQRAKPRWLMFLEQFANTMIVVLVVAAGISAFIGDVSDTVVILVIVIADALIGFVQEYRAERALAALKEMTAPLARVIRDRETEMIAASDVVPGDLLVLDTGDIVAADARLLEAPNLRINEAPLTGESVPADKSNDRVAAEREAGSSVPSNMALKGTSVVHGRATGLVTATGMDTHLGRIAGLLQVRGRPYTPLQRRLAVLGQRLAGVALFICALVFVLGVERGQPADVMFLTAVSLAVAAIPEALPAVVTVSLALGAQRMARERALVRKLAAVETLGSVTVICTDKTGTLTQGRMQVERLWTLEGEVMVTGSGYEPTGELIAGDLSVDAESSSVKDLLRATVLCNDAVLLPPSSPEGLWDVVGDPTEGALLVLAAKAGLERGPVERAFPRVAELPFEAARKRMTTLHETAEGGILVASKGAPETILAVADRVGPGDRERRASGEDLERIGEQAATYAEAGYRVLAVAGTRLPFLPKIPEEAERALTFHGLIAMADPLRPESARAVADCLTAGIQPVLITGDHPATARAIAIRAGIVNEGHRVVTGDELEAGSESLSHDLDAIAVFARTAPEQKLDIVEAWKARGHVVAMTGDGVNDAPALSRADIGVAMGIAGTEVAKGAADMVLSDDNFATIVSAIREGRRIYDNVRRFVRYMLTANSGEIWVMLLAPFVGLPLPLLPIQILWINLATDGLPALALGVEPPDRNVMRRPPRPPDESLFAGGLWQHVLLVGLLLGAIPLALGVWGKATGRPWQTMVFTSLALLQLGHTLAVRSERESLFALGLRTNPHLLGAVTVTAAIQLLVVYWAPAQSILHTQALAAADMGIVLLASTGVFWAVELEKLVRRRAPTATD
jgi:P-type Ca2+ transporter type 2C